MFCTTTGRAGGVQLVLFFLDGCGDGGECKFAKVKIMRREGGEGRGGGRKVISVEAFFIGGAGGGRRLLMGEDKNRVVGMRMDWERVVGEILRINFACTRM